MLVICSSVRLDAGLPLCSRMPLFQERSDLAAVAIAKEHQRAQKVAARYPCRAPARRGTSRTRQSRRPSPFRRARNQRVVYPPDPPLRHLRHRLVTEEEPDPGRYPASAACWRRLRRLRREHNDARGHPPRREQADEAISHRGLALPERTVRETSALYICTRGFKVQA